MSLTTLGCDSVDYSIRVFCRDELVVLLFLYIKMEPDIGNFSCYILLVLTGTQYGVCNT